MVVLWCWCCGVGAVVVLLWCCGGAAIVVVVLWGWCCGGGGAVVETELHRERASIARRQFFTRLESFCTYSVFAVNCHNFYPAFPENVVVIWELSRLNGGFLVNLEVSHSF